jgi:hypothetical protein
MASEIKSDKLSPSTGTALQIGDASDTITIPTGATFTITDGLGVGGGGTGLTSFTAGDVLYATGTTTLAKLAKGTGLQGLQTNSGATAPEWANSPQSLMTAAGDILYASGANTLAKLAKGSDDDVLTLASGVPSWAAAAGGGKILQVQSVFIDISTTNTTSATFVDVTGMTVDITPAATTSKIIVLCDAKFGRATGDVCSMRMMRDTTVIGAGADIGGHIFGSMGYDASGANQQENYGIQVMLVDSPSSTSATTYKVQYLTYSGTALYLNRPGSASSSSTYVGSSIIVMEIGA